MKTINRYKINEIVNLSKSDQEFKIDSDYKENEQNMALGLLSGIATDEYYENFGGTILNRKFAKTNLKHLPMILASMKNVEKETMMIGLLNAINVAAIWGNNDLIKALCEFEPEITVNLAAKLKDIKALNVSFASCESGAKLIDQLQRHDESSVELINNIETSKAREAKIQSAWSQDDQAVQQQVSRTQDRF